MKKVLCYLLLLALTLTLMPAATFSADVTFTDLNGHWAKNYVLPLAKDGIISGKAPGIFDPEANITRAEFITLVAKLTNLHPDEAAPYADVAENAWFAKTVSAAKAYGAIDGNLVADGNFKPDQPITRAEMTSVIVRLAEEIRGALLNQKDGFTDAATFADWTKDYIAKAAGEGIVTGNPDGSFNAVGNATRAEAAVIIKRFRDLLNKAPRKLEAGEYHPVYDAVIYEVDLQKMVDDAYAAGQKSLTLEKGAYRLKVQTTGGHLNLNDMKDFTLDGNGSTLLCQSPGGSGLNVTNCENVTVKNLNVDFEKLTMYQARITNINKDDGYFEFVVPNGYRDYFEDKSAFANDIYMQFYRNDGSINTALDSVQVMKFSAFESRGNRTYRYHSVKLTQSDIRVGDVIAGGNKVATKSGCGFTDSKECAFINVHIWGGAVGIYMTDGYGGHLLDGFANEPGPRPLGAIEDRVMSTIADSAHIQRLTAGPTIQNSRFAGSGDDGFNCYGAMSRVENRKSDTEIILARSGNFKPSVGNELRIYTVDGYFVGSAVIKTSELLEGYTPNSNLDEKVGAATFRAADYYRITFETAIKDIPVGGWVSNASRNCNGFVIRNNVYENLRPRGILVKGSDGIIEGNTIRNCAAAGIYLAPEFDWLESDYVRNVTVRNNTVDNCGSGYGDYGSIQVEGYNGWHNANIVIEGNTVSNSHGEDFKLTHITGLTLKDNTILDASPAARNTPSIYLDKVDGAVLSGNVWKGQRTEVKITDDTKNIQK